MADKNLALQLIITAKDMAGDALRSARDGVGAIGDAVSRALDPLRSFGALMTAALGIGGAKELQDRADAYTRLTNSLKTATSNEEAYQAALKAVTEIAQRANSDIETTAQLYGKVNKSADALGLSQQQVARLTESVAKGMQLSGASAEAADGAILQLTQAFASGALRGEEFNSVMEASPELMAYIAKGIGVTVGELRALAEQGALTSRTVATALLDQGTAIDQAYGKVTQTVAQAFTALNNQLILYVGQAAQASGITAGISTTLKALADNMDVVAAAIGAGLVTALTKSAAALVTYTQESLAARAAAREQAIAEASRQAEILRTAQAQVAATQGAYNRALAEQRLAQQTVAAMEAELGYGVTEAQLAAARGQAASAANAATAATQRYATAQAELSAVQAAAGTSAGLLSRAMGLLAGPGGLILLAVSAFAALLPMLSKSKTDTEALAVSTDRYSASLKELSAAQIRAEMLKLNAAITDQSQAVADAANKVGELETGHRSLYQVFKDSRPVADQLTEAEGNLANEHQKLTQLKKNLAAAAEALLGTHRQEVDTSGKLAAQYAQTQIAMGQLASTVKALAEHQNTLSQAQQTGLQAQIDLARANGDAQTVDRLTLALAQQKASAAQTQAALDQAAASAAAANYEAIKKAFDLLQQKLPKDYEGLEVARQDVTLKTAQAEAAKAVAAQLQDQAMRAAALNTVQLTQVSQLEALLSAQKNDAQSTLALAQAKGDEWTARQKIIEVAEIEARLAQLSAEKKTIELQSTTAVLQAIQAEVSARLAAGEAISDEDRARLKAATNAMNVAAIEAEAAGRIAEAETRRAEAVRLGDAANQQSADGSRQATESLQQHADAADKDVASSQSLAQTIASMIDYWRQQTSALSAATQALFEWGAGLSKMDPRYGQNAMSGLSDGAKKAAQEINGLTMYVRALDAQITMSVNDIAKNMDLTARAGAEAKIAYYEQVQAAEALIARLKDIGSTSEIALGGLVKQAQTSKDAMWLLNEQDLSKLQSAIDAATERLAKMKKETEDAKTRLAELNAELLSAEGEDTKAKLLEQQITYQKQLAEIKAQIAEAEASGNRELLATLNEQLAVLEKINDAKVRNIAADTTGGDTATRITTAWTEAGTAIKSAGSALADVYTTTNKLAGVDLSGLHQQITGVAEQAGKLASVL